MNDGMHLLAAQAPPAPGDLLSPARKGKPNGPSLFEEAMKARAKSEEQRIQQEKANAEERILEGSRSRTPTARKAAGDRQKIDRAAKKPEETGWEHAEETKKDPAEIEGRAGIPTAQAGQQRAADEKSKPIEESNQTGETAAISASGGQEQNQSVPAQLKEADLIAKGSVVFAGNLTSQTEETAEGVQQPGVEPGSIADLKAQELNTKQETDQVDLKAVLDRAQAMKGDPAVEGTPVEGKPGEEPQSGAAAQPKPATGEAILKNMQDVQVETGTNPAAEVKPKVDSPALNGSSAVISTYRGERAMNLTNSLEPARIAEAHGTEVVNQISGALEVLAKTRQSALRLQLNPEDLGRIDLRMTTSQNGLAVVLSADQAATGKMLEGELARLKQSLENAGIQVAHLSIRQDGANSQSFNSQHSFRGNDGRTKPVGGVSAVEEKVETDPMRPIQARTLIDYQV